MSKASQLSTFAAVANTVDLAAAPSIATFATVTYANTAATSAYSNAISIASADASTKATTAYSNAVSTAAGDATTKAAAAYSNAVTYAASNTYVNTQIALKANLSGAAFTGAVSMANTLSVTGLITGTVTTSNNSTNLGGQPASYYAISTAPGTAYSNAVSYAASVAATAYSNAVSYAASVGITTQGGGAPYYGARAWVNYDGSGNSIRAQGNVSSVGRPGTGIFTINFSSALNQSNYAVSGTATERNGYSGSSSAIVLAEYKSAGTTYYNKTSSSVTVCAVDNGGDSLFDSWSLNVVIHG